MSIVWVEDETPVRPQDLKFTPEQLEKCFGKKKTRKEFLKSLITQFDKKKEGD